MWQTPNRLCKWAVQTAALTLHANHQPAQLDTGFKFAMPALATKPGLQTDAVARLMSLLEDLRLEWILRLLAKRLKDLLV